jgi:4-hydroxybenzoate polyprenyltransferase
MKQSIPKKLTDIFFYGNIFAGLCAVALCIETNALHQLRLNGIHFYTIIFFGTVYFYTFLYLKGVPVNDLNERVTWYRIKYSVLKKTQNMILIFLVADILFFVWKYRESFALLNSHKVTLIVLFPLIALIYTYNVLPFPNIKKLRRIGWLKPFIMGFVWSGIITVYPIIFYQIQVGSQMNVFSLPSGLLWLQNLLFIATLSILFDIKDYNDDKKNNAKTFPVQFGINNTILFVLVPITIIGFVAFWRFSTQHAFPVSNIFINAVPYGLLFISLYSIIKKARGVIFCLLVIDGLMIAKAICGIAGMLLLK